MYNLTLLFESRLLGAIVDKGPSVIVIKDQDGGIFGGFASTSWVVNPHFTGKSIMNKSSNGSLQMRTFLIMHPNLAKLYSCKLLG